MPIYDYACSACGHVVEVVHRIDDHGPNFCPECGAEGTMSKGFAAPAVHFKGSGWAKKDRSSAKRTASTKDEAGTSKDAVPSSSGSGDESAKGSAGASKSTDESAKTSSSQTPSTSSSASD